MFSNLVRCKAIALVLKFGAMHPIVFIRVIKSIIFFPFRICVHCHHPSFRIFNFYPMGRLPLITLTAKPAENYHMCGWTRSEVVSLEYA